jgi:hypothetical protein
MDPLYAQVIAWVGLAVLLVLCLPFTRIQKLVLDVYAWALRLALLALLGAAAYLWFRPGDLPAEVTDTLNNLPNLKPILPAPGTQHFGVCAAALPVLVFLPLLAFLDIGRKLVGGPLRRLRALAAEPTAAPSAPAVEPTAEQAPLAAEPTPAPTRAPVVRRVDRRAAADTLAEAGSRRPHHAPGAPEP